MTTRELYDRLVGIYEHRGVDFGVGDIVVREPKNKGNNGLLEVTIRYGAYERIAIKDMWLQSVNKIYEDRSGLKQDCDQIIVTEFEGRKFIVFVELKSGFFSGLDKGQKQLLASRFTSLLLMMGMAGFDLTDYHFAAILAIKRPSSEDYTEISKKQNQQLELAYFDNMALSVLEDSLAQCAFASEVVSRGTALNQNLLFGDMPLVLFAVETDARSGEFQLEDVLRAL